MLASAEKTDDFLSFPAPHGKDQHAGFGLTGALVTVSSHQSETALSITLGWSFRVLGRGAGPEFASSQGVLQPMVPCDR